MENNKLERLKPYFTEDKFKKLTTAKVLVLGLGGVGGLVVEALTRSAINFLGIVDGDIVEESNFNRQIIAIDENIGLSKVDAMEKRIKSISNDVEVRKYNYFIDEKNINLLDIENYDLVLDCIDDVKAKILVIKKCKELEVEILSCMGTANKNDPNKFVVADINQTSYCPLAKKIRSELRKKQISGVKVCFSNEVPSSNSDLGSLMFIVGSASLVIANYAINYLISRN